MATTFPAVRLENDRVPGGPWIYARQVLTPDPPPEAGALVEVLDHSGRFVGHGLYNPESDIRVRIVSRGKRTELDRPREFLLRRIAAADRLRRKTLRLDQVTDAWRVVHGEGDDLSGLVVDKLGSVLVCEHHALGFWRLRHEVEWALKELHPETTVLHRVPASAVRAEGFEPQEAEPEADEVWIREHGLDFVVRPAGGHKTGWFCDQRDNRQRLAELSLGRHVLDLCTNQGGFALHAAHAGARRVIAVDLDEKALDRARRSAERNRLNVEFHHEDVFDTMRAIRSSAGAGASRQRNRPSVVVLDPHKIVRGRKDLEAGLRTYGDLNALAIECTAPGGILATFSCSGAVDLPTFLGVVFQAARRAEREIRLIQILGAAADHPQRPAFPRSRYLDGALLAVD
jgi:23S rRNA (cytosine1962-C5)-methyltransferase